MKYTIEIPFRLPSFNDYNNISRRNKWEASNFKKSVESDLVWCIKKSKVPKILLPVKINFLWIEKNKKRDLDNIFSAKKFILDALQKAGVLINDSQKYVVALSDELIVDKSKGDKVIVEIMEVE